MDLGATAMKKYSTLPKVPSLLEPYDQIFSVIYLLGVGGLSLCRDTVGVFYSPNQLGCCEMCFLLNVCFAIIYKCVFYHNYSFGVNDLPEC